MSFDLRNSGLSTLLAAADRWPTKVGVAGTSAVRGVALEGDGARQGDARTISATTYKVGNAGRSKPSLAKRCNLHGAVGVAAELLLV